MLFLSLLSLWKRLEEGGVVTNGQAPVACCGFVRHFSVREGRVNGGCMLLVLS